MGAIALTVVMLVVNAAAFILGFVVATRTPVPQGSIVPFGMAMAILVGFSLASFFLGIPRVFFYGLILAVAPLAGEALWVRGYASHHGFPVVFGVCAVVIPVSGIVRFARFLPRPQNADGAVVADGADD